ncbi:MAG: alpha/beta hydrolase [Ilumatobacter sp.]
MPLNAEAQLVIDAMAQAGAPPLDGLDPVEARSARTAMAPPVVDPCFETFDVDAGGVPARLYRPRPLDPDQPTGLLVFFHGGGFVLCDLETHDAVCQSLCARSGHSVLSVDYLLAPEHPFPSGLDDCAAATNWAHANAAALGIDPGRIAVGGDSAGANFAAVVAFETDVALRLQLLIYPVADARMGSDSYVENAEGYFLTRSSMQWFVDHYLAGDAGTPQDPRVSPILADDATLSTGPPAFVITAGFDPLRDEGIAYAARLAEAGVVTSHQHFPGQIHGFFSMPHVMSEARAAHASAAQALSDALG